MPSHTPAPIPPLQPDSNGTGRPASGGWLELILTLAMQAMASMFVLALPVIAPPVALAVRIPEALIGLYISVVFAGAMLSCLMAGPAVQRWGAVRISQAGLMAGAIGLALCCTGTLAGMALGALVIGAGYGPMTPASSHLLSRSSPPHRMSLMFSVKQTGVPLGGVLCGALMPGLMLWVGWRWALLIVGLACLACALLAQPLRQRLDAGRDPSLALGLRKLFAPARLVVSTPRLRSLAACSFFFSGVQLCLTTYAVIYLHAELGFGLVAAGLALSVCQFAGVIGRISWGRVADTPLGATRTLALLALIVALCCVGTALLTPATPLAVVIGLLFVFGATSIGWNGVFLAQLARLAPPGQAGTVTGGVTAFTFMGVVFGPPLFAWASTAAGTYRMGYGMLAIPMAWFCFSLWRSSRQA
ncbi:MAG: MFS transporter [Pseudomonadota bacterium]